VIQWEIMAKNGKRSKCNENKENDMNGKPTNGFTPAPQEDTLFSDTGLLGSHEPRTPATAPQRLPASTFQGYIKRGSYMASYQFDTDEACLFGVEAAIMLNNIRFWIKKNEANGKHFHEGRFWTYNSAKAFSELFPFWDARKIVRIISGLEDQGVLISGNYNPVQYDRTKWYSIDEQCIYQKRLFHLPKTVNGFTENGRPIPDIKPDIKPDKEATASPVVSKKRESTESLEPLLDGLSPSRRSSFTEWLQYKREKNQRYKPTGFKALLSQWQGKSDLELSRAVKNSMANNYSGIFSPNGTVSFEPKTELTEEDCVL